MSSFMNMEENIGSQSTRKSQRNDFYIDQSSIPIISPSNFINNYKNYNKDRYGSVVSYMSIGNFQDV